MTDLFPRTRDPDVFPPSVSQYSMTIPAGAVPPPHPQGIALPPALERATVKRKIQYLAGRACARRAIERLMPAASVEAPPRGADGCPVWPEGLVGSISHTDAFATAAVAIRSEAIALGVDAEPVLSPEAAAEIARLIASEDEARRVAEVASFSRPQALSLVFSAKESLFKALSPPTRKRFEYLDCEVARLDARERRFVIRFFPPFDALFGAADFAGRYEFANGEVRTGVLLAGAHACMSDLIRAAL
jgi:enterobactin synthetase component D